MEYPVFYSWQSDLPKKCNRRFIRESLDEAVRRVVAEGQVEDSPRVYDGMEGIAGSPEVASVMFQKIDRCALFVADTTLVGSIPAAGAAAKRVPNPNVSLEMGYAAGRIGWDRIICVMNEAYGERKDLPFDVRNRRFPIDYNLHADKMERKDKVQEQLIDGLVTATSTAVQNENRAVDDAIERLDRSASASSSEQPDALFPHQGAGEEGRATRRRLCHQRRLAPLDLRILRYNFALVDVGHQWAYHWTYLGKLVLKKMGMSDLTIHRP